MGALYMKKGTHTLIMTTEAMFKHTLLHVGLCVPVLCLLMGETLSAPCPTGRFYLGNVNVSQMRQVPSTGVYMRVPGVEHSHRPVYKHTNRQLRLFFTRTAMDAFWVVAPQVTSNLSDVTIRMTSESFEPTSTISTRWQVKDTGGWVTVPKLRTVCVDKDFGPCTSGKINVTGVRSQESRGHFMGIYSLHNVSQSLRPIYVKDGGSEVLYYGAHGLWVFSRKIGSNSIDLFTKDSALLPEFILEKWAYFNGFGLRTHYLSIRCIESAPNPDLFSGGLESRGCPQAQQDRVNEIPEDPEPSDALAVGNALPPGDLSTTEHGQPSLEGSSGCHEGVLMCRNGGTVILTGVEESRQVTCQCSGRFYGAHCELEIRCGAAPTVAMATLEEVVKEGMLVMAIYKCDAGSYSDSGYTAVCGMDARWLYLPVCRTDIFAGYDWSEVVP